MSGKAAFAAAAWVYSALGEKDRAFALLDKTFERRESWLRHSVRVPALQELESDPRYEALLQRMNEVLLSPPR